METQETIQYTCGNDLDYTEQYQAMYVTIAQNNVDQKNTKFYIAFNIHDNVSGGKWQLLVKSFDNEDCYQDDPKLYIEFETMAYLDEFVRGMPYSLVKVTEGIVDF